jgi:hypothetical protein
MAGVAAACQVQQKRTVHMHVEPNGYSFVPFSIESFGRLGKPAMTLLHALGGKAAGSGGVSQALFAAVNLQELSVGLVQGN